MRLLTALSALALLLPGISPAVAQDAPAIEWLEAERIDVTLSSFEFMPATIQMSRGQPYLLHLSNHSNGGHNFSAPEFFANAMFREGDEPNDKGAFELAGGEVRDIYIVPRSAGRFDLVCSHFMHAPFGMKGEIVVR